MSTNKSSITSPLTEAQLAYLSDQTERAAAKAARKESRLVLRRYVRGAVVAFLILLAGIGGSFYAQAVDSNGGRHAIVQSGQAIAVDGCNRDFETSERLQSILERGRGFLTAQFERGDISQSAYARGVAYYNQQLASLPSPDCRKALTILTDNADAKVRVPAPRYPGDGK